MKKIKLPRKRKKQYIKELGSSSYMSNQIVGEVIYEAEGDKRPDYNRFYKMREARTKEERLRTRNYSVYLIVKRY